MPPPWYEDDDSETITENQEVLYQSPELNIYPNPSTNKIELTITGLKVTNGDVEIYPITGNRIYFGRISSEKTIIDVSNFPSGIYICKYLNDNKLRILTKQIVIQNDEN